jgi:hypothetical protein
MLYDILKTLHIISATLLLTSVVYTFKLWLTSNKLAFTHDSLLSIQRQTWMLFIPTTLFQLASGFMMISLKQFEPSEFWIIGSVGGFVVLVISWFSFLYLLFNSSFTLAKNLYHKLQIVLLIVTGMTLLFVMFLMTSQIV